VDSVAAIDTKTAVTIATITDVVPFGTLLNTRSLSPEAFAVLTLGYVWIPLTEGLTYYRLYDTGVQIGYGLLDAADRFRESLDADEHDRRLQLIYVFLLDMLDKTDRWREYLRVFDDARAEILRVDTVKPYPAVMRDLRVYRPFMLDETVEGYRMHYLHVRASRLTVIRRKVDLELAGRKTGHLRHRAVDLDDGEIVRRLRQVYGWMVYGYDRYLRLRPRGHPGPSCR